VTAGHTPRFWLGVVLVLAVTWGTLTFFSLRQDRSAFDGAATGTSSVAKPPAQPQSAGNDAFGFGAGVGVEARCGHRCRRP
jgi:hypothetical protein